MNKALHQIRGRESRATPKSFLTRGFRVLRASLFCAFLAAALTLLSGCKEEGATDDVQSPSEMAEILKKKIHLGMPLESAKAYLVAEKFDCEMLEKAKWKKEKGLTYLHGSRLDGLPPIKRQWEVAVMHDGKVVTKVDLRSALVYP
jgi:hypothetical protein